MDQLAGVGLKIVSAFLFTVMAALIKWIGPTVPLGELVFARSFFAMVPILLMVAWRGEIAGALKTKRFGDHVWRSLIGSAAMFASFAGLSRLPLPDATAIGYAAPLVTVALAVVILKERVRIYRWSAVVVGFAGVLVTLWPHLGETEGGRVEAIGAGLAFLGACGAALAMVQVRRLTQTEDTATIVLYFSLLASVFGLLTLPFGWTIPDPTQAALLVAVGLLGGVAQIFLTQGYRKADASLIAPFEYTTMLWAVLIGYLAFDEAPSTYVAIGATIVIGSGVFVILRERQLGIKRARARKATPPT